MGQSYDPAEIWIDDFGDGRYLFRLPIPQLAELQEKRGHQVEWPDGSTGVRRKPFGSIWREHASGEYDPGDSREIIRLGLVGGGQGLVNGQEVKVSPAKAILLVERYVDGQPEEFKWKLATSILVACAQGYRDPRDREPPPGNAPRATETEASTSPASPETS